MPDIKVIDIGANIAAHRNWFTFLGLALIVAGLLAIAFPLAGGLAVETWIAVTCLIAGVAMIFHAFQVREWSGLFFGLLVGALYLAVAALLLINPLRGLVTLTALLAILLIAEGIMQAAVGFRLRPVDGWYWLVISAIVGIVVGVLVWRQLPSSAIWVLGTLLGVNFISSGLAFVFVARSAQPIPGTRASTRV